MDAQARPPERPATEPLSAAAMAAEHARLVDELAALRQANADQAAHLAELQTYVQVLLERERDLREKLVDAHDRLVRRDDDLRFLLRQPQTTRHRLVTTVRWVYSRLQWVPGIRLPLQTLRGLRRLGRRWIGRP